MKLVKPA